MEERSPEEIEVTTQKLIEDLKTVVRDGEELLKAKAKDLSQKGVAARERLAAGVQAANELRYKLQEQAAAGMRATDQLVRENPYQSLGIVFGLGVFVGMLLKRR